MLPSGSQLHRAMSCEISNFLPKVKGLEEEHAGNRGTELHRYLALIQLGTTPTDALGQVNTTFQDAADAIDLDKIPPVKVYGIEVAGAYNPKTGKGRILGFDLGRDYSKVDEDEFPFTIDRVGWTAEGELCVDDFKTGFSEYSGPAKTSWQLLIARLGIGSALGTPVRRGRFIYTEGQGRIDEVRYDDDAENYRRQLLDYIERISGKPGNTATVGTYCRYCPSFSLCPAKTGLVRQLAEPDTRNPLVREITDNLLSKENAHKAYARFREVQEVMKKVESALRAWAIMNPIQLENGKVYTERDGHEDLLDGRVVFEVLRSKYGDDVARSATRIEATKESIKNALKPIAEKGKHAAMVREVLSEIASLGGVTVLPRKRVEEFRE